MKFKADFITNSSSTSFVLCLPDKLSEEDMKSLIEKIFIEMDRELDSINDVDVQLVEAALEDLASGDILWQEENDSLFYALSELAKEKEWIVESSASDGGCGQITAITKSSIDKIRKIKNI